MPTLLYRRVQVILTQSMKQSSSYEFHINLSVLVSLTIQKIYVCVYEQYNNDGFADLAFT